MNKTQAKMLDSFTYPTAGFPAFKNDRKAKKNYLRRVINKINRITRDEKFDKSSQELIESAFWSGVMLAGMSKQELSVYDIEAMISESIVTCIEQSHHLNLYSGDAESKRMFDDIKTNNNLKQFVRGKLSQQIEDLLSLQVDEVYSKTFWNREQYTCSMCQTTVESSHSHNPEPVNEGRCCEDCNESVVWYRTQSFLQAMQQQKESA